MPLEHLYGARLLAGGRDLLLNYLQGGPSQRSPKSGRCSAEISCATENDASELYEQLMSMLGKQSLSFKREKTLLVLLNPVGGDRRAEEIYETIVRPMLQAAEIKCESVRTGHALHAQQVCASIDLCTCSGIVVVGGDGLLHECVNGLLSRSNWRETAGVPIGIVPAGTSNAVAKSFGVTDPTWATLTIINGHTRLFDAILFEQGSRRFYGHFAFMWGLFADIDIMGDSWRRLGRSRLAVSTFLRLTQMRNYKAVVSYITVDAVPEVAQKMSDATSIQPSARFKALFDAGNSSVQTIPETRYYSFLSIKYPWLDKDFCITKRMPSENRDSIDVFLLAKRSGGVTRTKLCRAFARGDGALIHDNPALCEHLQARALQIRFTGNDQVILDVDGERVPAGDIYVENIPDTLRFLVSPQLGKEYGTITV